MISAVVSIAKKAGARILEIYVLYKDGRSTDLGLSSKSDASPLTVADLAAHNVIKTGLTKLTPVVPVVSEEDESSLVFRKPTGRFWLVDPLDGTKEFLAKNDQFTVNIALIENARPVWGVVYAPAMSLLYVGGAENGAQRELNGRVDPIHVATMPAAGTPLRVVASKSHMNAETEDFIKELGVVNLVQAGSSLKLCRVAEGAADLYPRLAPTCEWDTAAAQAVLEGAGGYVLDVQGKPLVYGKPEVLNPHFIATSVPFKQLRQR